MRQSHYNHGAKVAHYRQLKQMTQEQLADCMRISPNLLKEIEAGDRSVTVNFIVNCANVLGIDASLLISAT